MSDIINKQTLENLAQLARLELDPAKEEKMLKDLQAILGHFDELKSIDTNAVEPMTGGTHLRNALRDDAADGNLSGNTGKGLGSFPDKEGSYLKVPPVF